MVCIDVPNGRPKWLSELEDEIEALPKCVVLI